ncbi:Coq4 family protein [Parablastomonas sp. CN1-191]|uniref:Coq4 family protein n=1 Tax=Parablastomonas sp. CN1-191 TaxID=3400908 RepID=UPI003BF87B3E
MSSPPAIPFADPRRIKPRYRPLKAWHHFRLLVKDKEATEHVTPIFESLPWTGVFAAAKAFFASEKGKAIRASEPSLPPILDDHAALRRLPAGTLAHAYCDFMEREGLTAQGLVDDLDTYRSQPDFGDQVEWYFHRMRDTHDMMHVLTGYGRDALGEQCVLAFTYSQQPSPAHLFLGYAGALEIKKRVRSSAPVLRAVREAQRLGKACPRIAEMSIRDLLATPLEDLRRQLGITRPVHYWQAHKDWQAMGVNPYDLLGKAA